MYKIRTFVVILLMILIGSKSHAFQNQDKNVTLVKNIGAKWKGNSKIKLEKIATIGGINEKDENLDFYNVIDFTIDNDGFLYTLMIGQGRIRKYDTNGNFISAFGKTGQGPAEFSRPHNISVDKNGEMYIDNLAFPKIIVLEKSGKEKRRFNFKLFVNKSSMDFLSNSNNKAIPATYTKKSIVLSTGNIIRINNIPGTKSDFKGTGPDLVPLFAIYDNDGDYIRSFGGVRDYGEWQMNFELSYRARFIADNSDNIYVTFERQNRIEKYDAAGNLVLRIERPLNFEETTNKETYIGGTGRARLRMNIVSSGIALDSKERIWVVTRRIQGRGSEEDILFQFDIFDNKGSLLTQMPFKDIKGSIFDHFSVKDDFLYTIHDLTLNIYRIVDVN